MFFSSIKEINRLFSIKEISRLLIVKTMSYFYLKVTVEKNGRSQNFHFLSLTNSPPGQFLGNSSSRSCKWILNFLLRFIDQRCRRKNVCVFSIILILKGTIKFSIQRVHKQKYTLTYQICKSILSHIKKHYFIRLFSK